MNRCYEVAKQLMEEAKEKLGEVYRVDPKKSAFLPEVCAAVDSFAEAIGCEVLDVSMAGEQNDFVFTLISDDITLDEADTMRQFANLLVMIDSVRFERARYDDKGLVKLRTDFAIHKMWKGVDE